MRVAKKACVDCSVNLLSTQYTEDETILPEWIQNQGQLSEQMSDHSSFKVHRKLPVIREILGKLRQVKADYYIYSNVDISVQPSFYNYVNEKIEAGYDAFVINRRTISKEFDSPDQYEEMCTDKGQSHPGFDCFVFPADYLSKFELGNAGLGANWIGRVIITNLIVLGKNFTIFKDAHQTFHIGDDRSWKNPDFADYDAFNRSELIKILLNFREKFEDDAQKMSYLNEFLYKDMKWNEDGSNPYMQPQSAGNQSILARVRNKIVNWLR